MTVRNSICEAHTETKALNPNMSLIRSWLESALRDLDQAEKRLQEHDPENGGDVIYRLVPDPVEAATPPDYDDSDLAVMQRKRARQAARESSPPSGT